MEASVKRRRDLNVKVYFYECNMYCLVLGLPPIKALKANEVGKITLTTEACFWNLHEQLGCGWENRFNGKKLGKS